jgi:hypothetical protein
MKKQLLRLLVMCVLLVSAVFVFAGCGTERSEEELAALEGYGAQYRLLVPTMYDSVGAFSEGFAGVGLGNNGGFIDKNGRLLGPMIYSSVSQFYNGYAAAAITIDEQQKWGFIDRTGAIAVPFQYDWVRNFSDGLVAVSLDGKMGVVDTSGNIVVPFEYDFIGTFSEGLAQVSLGDFYGYIDTSGRLVIPIEFNRLLLDGSNGFIWAFNEGLAPVRNRHDPHPSYI